MLARTKPSIAPLVAAPKLPMAEAIRLYDALRTICDVIDGLYCQPRFRKDDGRAGNAAGDELEDIGNTIAMRMAELVDEVSAARPTEPFYQEERIEFLLRHAIGDDPHVSAVATAAVRAVFQDRF